MAAKKRQKRKVRARQQWDGGCARLRTNLPAFVSPDWFDFSYTQPNNCNDKARNRCQVKFGFEDGQPVLRTCKGTTVQHRLPVNNPAEAVELAEQICKCFDKTKSYAKCVPKRTQRTRTRGVETAPEFKPIKLRGLGDVYVPKGTPQQRRRGTAGSRPRWIRCRRIGKLTAAKERKLPKSAFGLPNERKYPMPDPSHAANAKARARQQLNKGKLSKRKYNQITQKADRVINACRRS